MALDKQDIEKLGWRHIRSVSQWETYKYKTFSLSVFPNEVVIRYLTRYAKNSMELFKGKISNVEALKKVMRQLQIS